MAVHITQDADGMVDCLKVLEEQTQGHGFALTEKGESEMRDYDELDELIVNLRNCAKVNSLSMYKRGLMKQAADAVEKLQQNIEQYKLYLQDAINDLRSAHEKEQKWISVEERLPLYGQDVLAVRTYGDGEKCQKVLMAHIAVWNEETGEKWWNATNITHWMPLPEPPKEERKDDEHTD